MWVEVALLLTWVVVVPYLIVWPPQRFWFLRQKLEARSNRKKVQSLVVKPKWMVSNTASGGGGGNVKVAKKVGTTNTVGGPGASVQVPGNMSSVLVFVNPKSGGQLGATLLANLRSILHPSQVVNLVEEKPETAIARFQGSKGKVRLIACGGDGTVGWVMNSATQLGSPWPMAILPLGTGNDLARSLGWGRGATSSTVTDASLVSFLASVAKAKPMPLDRWTVTVTELANSNNVKTFTMNNYVSIGIDAEIGLKFHNERQKHPERFSSQAKNVFKYAMFGFDGAFEGVALGQKVSCSTEAGELDVNPHWKGLVVNNLPVYQGGKDFWGTQESEADIFQPVNISDGHLEVMGLSGTFHIGLVHIAVDNALRLAQPKEVAFRCEEPICIQVDGEPFDHPPCTITVAHTDQYPVLHLPENI